MKKVLYLTNYPAPYRVAFFSELGKYCNLTVLFDETEDEQEHRNKEWFSHNFANFNAIFLKKKKFFGKNVSFEVIKWLKNSFDSIIIGVYSTFTAQLAILYMNRHKIGFIIETDGGIVKNGKGLLEKWKKRLISSANMWLSPSKNADSYLSFYGADINRIYRYPFTSLNNKDILNSCPTKDSKSQIRKELGINSKYIVLSVGQFIYRKGNDILIRAASKINSEAQIVIVGGKPTKEYIQLIEDLNLNNVSFIDFKNKKLLAKYYLSADVFVMPTREDIWGLVINEAMAFGLPIISSDRCMAALELITENENGYIVHVEDYLAIAEKVNQLLNDNGSRLKMGEKSLTRIKGYTIEEMTATHIKILDL